MAYAFGDEDVKIWFAEDGEAFPREVIEHFASGGLVTAHNASFEQHLFEFVIGSDYDFDPPKPEQWRCSMAMCLASGYAGGLDTASKAMGLKYKKQAQGTRLIKDYCAPGFLTEWKPGDRELMDEYCVSDVLVMREMCKCLRQLTDDEWAEYALNSRINDRGIPIDEEFCKAALAYTWDVAEDANRQITELTGGMMTKHTQRKGRDAWLFPKLTEYHMKLLEIYKKGEKKISMDQDHRSYLLACDDLDPDARELIELIDGAGSSALKKYGVAANQNVDGRVHNTFVWHGAQTGRFSGKNLQPHNFRRDAYSANEAESLIQDVIEGYELENPSVTLARLLRSMVYSKKGIYYVDWSAIEGRVAPWIANSAAGERKLDLYRAERDVYVVTAAEMFHLSEAEIDDNFRQSGKISELSLQFGGSHNALIGMAKNYGVTFELDTAKDIVKRWRHANPWAGAIWADFDLALCGAVQAPGSVFQAGRCKFYSDGVNFMWCELPSGRFLSYPKPKWEPYTTPWGEERVGPTFQTHFKPAAGEPPLRNHLRGALLFQNACQGIAADLLREALIEAEFEELNVIAHIHDEIIIENTYEKGCELNEIMLEVPSWAKNLPIATGGVKGGTRFSK